jgi:UDP:flavonoid glycosyltransferase YjiC (YdhE family)
MRSVCAQADAVVCNAGSGTVCTALQAGLPVLLFPMHAEQLLFSIRVTASGAGLHLLETEARERTGRAVNRLLKEPGFREAARGFAARYPADATHDVAADVAARLGALAASRTG